MNTPDHDTTARVTVIIPTYNGETLLPLCLDALERQLFRDFETVVVDNGSQDGSITLLEERYPHVAIIRLPRNLGFAPAVNAGIRRSRSKFIALLNNDAVPEPRWLGELVSTLAGRHDISFCASRMLDYRNPAIIDSAGNSYALNGRSLPRGFLARDSGQYEQEEEVFGACAGAALYRRALFDRVGLFDESFSSYKEDVDLDFRAQLAGERCLYVPGAVCRHMGGATTGKRKSDLAMRLSTRNGIITFIKNMPAPFLARAIPLLLFDLLFQLGYHLVTWRQPAAFIRGCAGALPRIPRALRERRRIQRAASPDIPRLRDIFTRGSEEVRRNRARCRARERKSFSFPLI